LPAPADLWRGHLAAARWFQGKGLPLGSLSLRDLPWYVCDGDVWVRSELASAQVGDTSETYHLLVGYLPTGLGEPEALIGQTDLPGRGLTDVVDATRSPRAMRALLAALVAPHSPVTWLEAPPAPDSPTEVFAGEQSNTTVRIGDDVLFKVFRRLDPGPNIEAGMLSALSRSGITPRLIGMLSAPDGSSHLGLFTQRIPRARDGWVHCVDACRGGQPVGDEMAALGATLRRLHGRLADVYGASRVDGAEITSHMLSRLDAACEQVPDLDHLRAPLREILDLTGTSVDVQRVHGDFHLGQALISPAGWTIIDFEGEPLKSPAERAAPDAVWRDVAGLLRSLDYARHAHPAPDGAAARRRYTAARAAFLDGYLADAELPLAMLTAYEVDKAIYELVYETRNRPSWAHIPRHAIEEAVGAG